MDYSHKIYKANDFPDAPPTRAQYDEDAVRRGARELIAQQRRRDTMLESARAEVAEEMAALKAENTRLRGCIAELEREACKEPRGFEMTEREFLRQRSLDDRHNSLEATWNGRIDNPGR